MRSGRDSAASKQWDSYEWRERFPDYANRARTSREWATNHLFGRGWWVWIIPLQRRRRQRRHCL